MRSSWPKVVAVVELIASEPPAHLEPADLAGLRILVAGVRVTGRSAALHLASFGADVLACDDAEVGARLARAPLVGVTGTNGKSTTVELAAAMLSASGLRTVAAGNLGLPLIDAVLARQAPQALVVELSSFQLRFCHSLHLVAGAWLNFAPDHLDWHPDLSAYAEAKARIWANQTLEDWSLYAADDPVVASHAVHATGTPVPFGVGRVPLGGLGVEAGIALSRIEGHEGPLWRAAALRL